MLGSIRNLYDSKPVLFYSCDITVRVSSGAVARRKVFLSPVDLRYSVHLKVLTYLPSFRPSSLRPSIHHPGVLTERFLYVRPLELTDALTAVKCWDQGWNGAARSICSKEEGCQGICWEEVTSHET